MAFGNAFFKHDVIRKMVIVFGNLFNDLIIERSDSSGARVQNIKIPLSYGPKEAFLTRLQQDPNVDKDVAIQLPRMAFEMNSMQYSSERKLNTIGRNVKYSGTDKNKLKFQYNSVPWDFNFTLFIMTANANDGVMILEQILPFFTPEWTSAVNTVPELGIVDDIKITIQSVQGEDSYQGDFTARRSIIWTLDFILAANLYGPVKTKEIIKKTITNIPVPATIEGSIPTIITDKEINNTADTTRVTLTPGLTSEGRPTSNTQLSVGISNIDADDDYGFIKQFGFFTDGENHNGDDTG